ncbi:MAG TPA: CDP-alcohol phosphatidyltransferase family protein [Planctomycetota bacterium]|nr:CDP-alcohol phosphatidyltransferase family protein [Planctomycetota bacterium]
MEINRNVLLPNLLTVANGVCGFAAITVLFKVSLVPGSTPLDFTVPAAFSTAAWLILLGMVFDVFDGKVARLSGGSSALGAQLDSLCDLVTFGLAPALIMLRLSMGYEPTWQRLVWFFSLAYFLGALLRLARFTAENEPDEGAHVAFKGLPSPGAAGCVASLVIFYSYISDFKARELQWVSSVFAPETLKDIVSYIPRLLPCLGLLLGFTMISNRLRFEHFGSWFFNRKHSFDFFAYLIFGAILTAVVPEVVLPVVFLGYLIYTPVKWLLGHRSIRKQARLHDGSRTP